MQNGKVLGAKEEQQQIPAILVGWSAEHQAVNLQFDIKAFKTWDFVIAVLGMAVEEAKIKKDMARMKAMQEQHVAALQNEAIRRSIGGP